jgi:hypothetical protein
MNVFQNHLGTFFHRKEIYSGYSGTSSFISGSYYLFSILFGNSIYPWDIRFVILLLIAITAGLGIIIYYKTQYSYSLKTYIQTYLTEEKIKSLYTLRFITIALCLLFLIQSVISGTAHPRGLLILPILLVIIIAVSFYHSNKNHSRKLFYIISTAVASFFLIWLIGSYNVITKKNLHKTGLMDPINEVALVVKNINESGRSNIIVITYDPVLTYYLAKSASNNSLTIFSPYINESSKLLVSVNAPGYHRSVDFDSTTTLIYIQSYPGSLIPLKERLNILNSYILNAGVKIRSPIKLGFDSDAMMKRRFFPSADILDWRYIINVFHPKYYWDEKRFKELNSLKVY